MKLLWSRRAVDELVALRAYSIEHWGVAVARRYLQDVRDAAQRVARDPRIARRLNDRFRLFRVRSHYLILQLDDQAGTLTVARVLHCAMDLERHLPDD